MRFVTSRSASPNPRKFGKLNNALILIHNSPSRSIVDNSFASTSLNAGETVGMLDGKSSAFAHQAQNIALLLLSLVFLPLDSLFLVISYALHYLGVSSSPPRRQRAQEVNGFQSRTILVTGVGMTKGLVLARLFYEAGHNVIGADFEPNGALVCGRVSKSLKNFYSLTKPSPKQGSSRYIQGLLDIVTRENVDLWVSCSGVASAVEDGEAKEIVEGRTTCKAIQFDVKTTQMLHEKDSFIAHTASLGLTIPETHTITSHEATEKILKHSPSTRKFIMKPIGVDDSSRADMTILPRPTPDATTEHISRLRIAKSMPWILQQYIKGPEYCTHALVIKGEVKAFVACPSAELLMHYEALPPDSVLRRAMLRFTQTFAAQGGENFTGHLSFDFLVEDTAIDAGDDIVLYPIECNPRAHTAVVLFNGNPTELANAYLSVLDQPSSRKGRSIHVVPVSTTKYFWIGHDLVELLLLPLLSLSSYSLSAKQFSSSLLLFLEHLLLWKDGTYELWDPLPWWWLYHVYWPMQFWNSIRTGNRWSRINVSTTKMFGC